MWAQQHSRTFLVDPEELCWWDLKALALKCGEYIEIHEIYYLLPNSTFEEGSKRVYHDKEVLEMAKIAKVNRGIDLYVVHAKNTQKMLATPTAPLLSPNITQQPDICKLTPKKAPPRKSKLTPKESTQSGPT